MKINLSNFKLLKWGRNREDREKERKYKSDIKRERDEKKRIQRKREKKG